MKKKKNNKNTKKEKLFTVVHDDYEQGAILADDEKREEKEELLEQTKNQTFQAFSYIDEMTVDNREEWEKIELRLRDKSYIAFVAITSFIFPLIFFPLFAADIYIKLLKWIDFDIEKIVKNEITEIKKERALLKTRLEELTKEQT